MQCRHRNMLKINEKNNKQKDSKECFLCLHHEAKKKTATTACCVRSRHKTNEMKKEEKTFVVVFIWYNHVGKANFSGSTATLIGWAKQNM